MDTNERLLRAVQLSARKLVSAGHFDQLLREVLILCIEAVGAFGGTVYLHDPVKRTLRFHHVLPESVASRLPFEEMPDDRGIAGQVFHSRQTVVSSFDGQHEEVRKDVEQATGVPVHTMITVPLMMEDEEPIGVVQLINKQGGNFTEADAAVLDTVAAVSTMASMNSQLLEEATRASSLLGMGKVSHDITNLAFTLSSSIEYTGQAITGMGAEFGENDAIQGYIESLTIMNQEMDKSVKRIVSYADLISRIAAGQPLRPIFELAPLAETIQLSASYLESDGRRNSVAIRYDIETGGPATLHDEQYIFRIVQNLVGNAIKAVKETIPEDWRDQFADEDEAIFGEVQVRYRFAEDEHIVEVHDTGPGIPPLVAERILAGTARSQWGKASGSGWGTKIVLELAATHGGTVSIDSTPGHGATFRVKFPHRAT